MKWPASSHIACWLISVSRSLKLFDGKADISITWRPRGKPAFPSGTSPAGEQEFSVESRKCCRQISPGHVQAEACPLENPASGKKARWGTVRVKKLSVLARSSAIY